MILHKCSIVKYMQPSLNSEAVNICRTDEVEPFPIAVAYSRLSDQIVGMTHK